MRYKGSIAVEEVNGSAGAVTGSKAKGVPYLKNKPIPTNPRTTKQQSVRGAFGTNAKDYSALPFETAQAWNEAAKGKLGRQMFGIKAGISGINLFVQTNQNIVEAGGTTITDVPTPSEVEVPALELLGVDSYNTIDNEEGTTTGVSAVVAKEFTMPTGYALVVRTTGTIYGNKVYVKNKLRVLTNTPGTAQITAETEGNEYKENVTVVYFNYDGYRRSDLPSGGDRIAFELYFINKTTGQRSAPYYIDATTGAKIPKKTN